MTANPATVMLTLQDQQLAMKHHPYKGGDPELFLRVQQAWDQFQKMLVDARA